MEPVLRELEQTEKAYVRDLELLCSGFVEPLRAEHVLTRDEELAVFSNCEMIKGVNQELLAALQQPAAAGEPVQHLARCFSRMAPFLRCYADYCGNFVTANDRLDGLRAKSSKLDAAFQQAEIAATQTVGSMLIKPVQRLCKYPLLFRELCKEVPESHPARPELVQAAAAVQDVAKQVNERVREAERRADMMALAEAVREPELVTPSRALVHEAEVSVQRLASSRHGAPGARACWQQSPHVLGRRRACPRPASCPSLLAWNGSFRRAGARQTHRLWLCSDVLLLGRPGGRDRHGSFSRKVSLGHGKDRHDEERYALVEREMLGGKVAG